MEGNTHSEQEYNGFHEEGQRHQDIALDDNNNNNSNNNDNEIFGDRLAKQKHKDMVRIGFSNVNRLPSF